MRRLRLKELRGLVENLKAPASDLETQPRSLDIQPAERGPRWDPKLEL